MDARQLLDRVKQKYATCATYTDEGLVTFQWSPGKDEQLKFKTSFKRSDSYLCFQWQDCSPSRPRCETFSTFWSDGVQNVVDWCASVFHKVESHQSRAIAMSDVSGCCAGAVLLLPELLFNTTALPHAGIGNLTDPVLHSDEMISDEQCHVVAGSTKEAKQLTVWIRKRDMAVFKVREESWTPHASAVEHANLLADEAMLSMLTEHGIDLHATPKSPSIETATIYSFDAVAFDGEVQLESVPAAHA